MKKNYIFLFVLCILQLHAFAQDCSTAQAHIVYAFSHSKDALEANNVTHAKHFAAKAKEAFERVQEALKDCQCMEVDDYVYDAIGYLAKAKDVVELEDAYYYANKGKDLADKTINQLDVCTSTLYSDAVVIADAPADTEVVGTDELSSIAYEQEVLKQQQLELERKQAQIKQRIAQQKQQELRLRKEQLILEMEQSVSSNVKAFNAALKACDCDAETLRASLKKSELESKSVSAIKLSFIGVMKELTSNYMKQLADCDEENEED